MYTTSSVTASGRDQAPSNKSNLKNWMCLFILTRPDGTLFDAAPVSEEDIMEICIKIGHTLPVGVLCYSATELVALFCSTEDMQCTTNRAIKVTMWWDEAITIRTMAPLEIHIKMYVRAVGRDPLKLQFPPSEEEGELHTPTDNPLPSGATLHHLQVELGDLTDCKLCQLVENLCQEITVHELNAASVALHQNNGETHQGAGIPMEMTRRSPFQEGRVGSPGATIPISSPNTTRWRMGSYGTISFTTKSCST